MAAVLESSREPGRNPAEELHRQLKGSDKEPQPAAVRESLGDRNGEIAQTEPELAGLKGIGHLSDRVKDRVHPGKTDSTLQGHPPEVCLGQRIQGSPGPVARAGGSPE